MSQIARARRLARRIKGKPAGPARGSKQGQNKGWSPAALKRYGFEPATLVDVGVSNGTVVFYETFPDAALVLVEPLAESERRMKKLLRERPGEYVLAAAGAEPGRAIMNVEPRRRGMSSMLQRTEHFSTGDQAERRNIPMTTLDLLAETRHLEPPFGLKLNTEGYELEVIKGAQQFLKSTQFVVAEVSIAPRFRNGYTFADFVAAMDAAGFGVCQVLSGGRSYADLLFTPYEDIAQRHATASDEMIPGVDT